MSAGQTGPRRTRSCPSLVAAAFEAVSARLEGRAPRSVYSDSALCAKDAQAPLFVTFNTLHDDEGLGLRGCIGSLQPLRVRSGVGDFALRSAFSDRRFSPIQSHELPRLHCCVSLLTDYEDGAHALDWVTGTHGIIIEFVDPRGVRRSATYLPEVAQEQGWDQRTAVANLVHKAGWTGSLTEELLSALKLTRYQSSKCGMSYSDWHNTWRDGVPHGHAQEARSLA